MRSRLFRVFRTLPSRRRRRNERGVVLLLSALTLVILVVIVHSFVSTITVDAIIAENQKQTITTYWAARGGLLLGSVHLELDDESAFDSLNEPWAKPIEGRQIGQTQIEVVAIDEERRFNILALVRAEKDEDKKWAAEVLKRLIEIARNEDNETLESEELSASDLVTNIREWLEDTDASGDQDATLSETGPSSGAANIEKANEVEINKSSPFEILTVAELMQVKGVTRELLYGPPKTELEKQVDPEEEPVTDPEDEEPTRVALLDFITISSSTPLQVNINTAPKEVLVAVMQADGMVQTTAESVADSIIAARMMEEAPEDEPAGSTEEEPEDTASFRAADIAANGYQAFIEKIDNQELQQEAYTKLRARLTVRSRFFTVASTATESQGEGDQAKKGRIKQTWRALYQRTRQGTNYTLVLLSLDNEE
ncbi:MAG: general secretion pathway protein GspK [Planctomycetota bacterium]